ncbi:Agamous-like mads-box protein [Thalictrum thalictroides]|uniref:Agamous-like mads-box protein n=1 Tax=Thalictrum thalictroides TaxID=46969 RepID=A0A7J6VD85_THATH|nr:Agamous-like mads-box protein [Thalictrum thalictroides]
MDPTTTTTTSVQKKKSTGRKKIAIEKIERSERRQVTFSKRRMGLFKKASELCILCAAEVAILVSSPAGKLYTFGYPCVESTLDRFLNQQQHDHHINMNNNNNNVGGVLNVSMQDQQQQHEYNEIASLLEQEKKRGEALEFLKKGDWSGGNYNNNYQFWWDAPIENLEFHELNPMKTKLEELRNMVASKLVVDHNINNSSCSRV